MRKAQALSVAEYIIPLGRLHVMLGEVVIPQNSLSILILMPIFILPLHLILKPYSLTLYLRHTYPTTNIGVEPLARSAVKRESVENGVEWLINQIKHSDC
jgi:hypothetical protein